MNEILVCVGETPIVRFSVLKKKPTHKKLIKIKYKFCVKKNVYTSKVKTINKKILNGYMCDFEY